MDQAEINSDIAYLNEFNRNVIRAMNIRLKIIENREKAIVLLKKDFQDPEGLTLLDRAIRNERRFLGVIEKGLKNSFDKLKEIYSWMSKNTKDKEAKNNAKRLIEIVEIFYSKFGEIGNRLAAEEVFLARKDKNSFKNFEAMWKEEIKVSRKLTKKVVDADDLLNYFRNLKGFLSNAAAGGGTGLAMAAGTVVPLNLLTSGEVNQDTALFVGFATLFGIAATMCVNLLQLEELMASYNVEELKGLGAA